MTRVFIWRPYVDAANEWPPVFPGPKTPTDWTLTVVTGSSFLRRPHVLLSLAVSTGAFIVFMGKHPLVSQWDRPANRPSIYPHQVVKLIATISWSGTD